MVKTFGKIIILRHDADEGNATSCMICTMDAPQRVVSPAESIMAI